MNKVKGYMSDVSEAMMLLDIEEIDRVGHIVRVIKEGGGTIYLFGNGGSHSTAGHFANDLMKAVRAKSVCLGDMTSAMLAYGNDNGWKNMFRGPLAGMLNPNDWVIGISCGGESENVLAGLEYSISQGNLTVGLTGLGDTTRINKIGLDAIVHVRSNDIKVQEDLHLMVCHAVVRAIQEAEWWKNLRSASIRNNMLTERELAEMVLGKKCPTCGETDVAKFSKDKHRSDGLQTYCKKCSQRKSLTVDQMVERAVAYVAGKESKDDERIRWNQLAKEHGLQNCDR